MLDYTEWADGYAKANPEHTVDDLQDAWIQYRTQEYLKHDEAEIDRKITEKLQAAKPEELVETFDKSALVHTTSCGCKECRVAPKDIQLVQVQPKKGHAKAGVRIIRGLDHLGDNGATIQSRDVVSAGRDPKQWLPESVVERLKAKKVQDQKKAADDACIAALKELKLVPKTERKKASKQPLISASQLLDLNNPVIKNARRKASLTVTNAL